MGRNGVEFSFSAGGRAAGGDVLVVPLLVKPAPPMELVSRVDATCDDAISELLELGAVGEEAGALAHTTRGGAYRRIVAVGLGAAEKLTLQQIRVAAAAAARWLIAEKRGGAALWVDGLVGCGVEGASACWAEAMALAGFRYAEHVAVEKPGPAKIAIELRASEAGHSTRVLPEMREAAVLASAVNYARRLAHDPPNVVDPETLADEVRQLARRARLKCTVIAAPRLKQMKMMGILAVGAGAAAQPCLIELEYRGSPRARSKIALVGKAVTFDTGGYSIKPADGLEKLKFDKCGAMAVLGTMLAASQLRLKCNLVGIIPAAENAISDRAYRPGDILRMYSGKTVEVTNTDAEGRLILADALWYAQEKHKPTHLIDLATLTGGVRVALGVVAAGLMSNDDNLAADLEEAGRRTHERLWRLPLWDEYRELIKGTDSDIKNSSGKRDAHSIVGGMFLKEFVRKETSWAHLDIAATATAEEPRPPLGKGATGFGVRLLVEFLRKRSG